MHTVNGMWLNTIPAQIHDTHSVMPHHRLWADSLPPLHLCRHHKKRFSIHPLLSQKNTLADCMKGMNTWPFTKGQTNRPTAIGHVLETMCWAGILHDQNPCTRTKTADENKHSTPRPPTPHIALHQSWPKLWSLWHICCRPQHAVNWHTNYTGPV